MCCHLCECLCVCVCGRERASEHIYSRIDHPLAAPPSLLAQHGVHTHDTRNTHHTQAYTHTCTHTHHDKKAEARRRVCTIAMPHHVAVSMCVRVSIRAYVCAHGDENQGIHTKPFEVYTPSLSKYTHQAFRGIHTKPFAFHDYPTSPTPLSLLSLFCSFARFLIRLLLRLLLLLLLHLLSLLLSFFLARSVFLALSHIRRGGIGNLTAARLARHRAASTTAICALNSTAFSRPACLLSGHIYILSQRVS